jgi:hypothetical protein
MKGYKLCLLHKMADCCTRWQTVLTDNKTFDVELCCRDVKCLVSSSQARTQNTERSPDSAVCVVADSCLGSTGFKRDCSKTEHTN